MPPKHQSGRPETIELTEALILHGDSLQGGDPQKAAKLERIREALRSQEIDFVDQPEALEIWTGTAGKDRVLALLRSLGYHPDLYQI